MNRTEIFASDIRNQTILSDDDKIRFYFFGCWNQNMIATNDVISRVNTEGLCTFGVVCGDNVYPEKKDDVKIANIENIRMGFDILKTFRGNIYIGLGNHEVDSTEPCKALFDEKLEATANLIMLNNYYSISINSKTSGKLLSKIIILDTNLLEENTCYGPHDPVLENEMIEWLNFELLSCGEVMPIVMGHYPLFYFKQNKKTQHFDFQIKYTMNRIYEKLLHYAKPLYYLCADVHNYQCIITSNITQHVVGTGGADQDRVIEVNLPFTLQEKGHIFNIIKCTQKYGYLDVDIENNIITGEFKVSDVPVIIKEPKIKKTKSEP